LRFILQLVEAAWAGMFESKSCCIKSKGIFDLMVEMAADIEICIICYRKLCGKVRNIRYLEAGGFNQIFSRNERLQVLNNVKRDLFFKPGTARKFSVTAFMCLFFPR
jgi:hypothetical protein